MFTWIRIRPLDAIHGPQTLPLARHVGRLRPGAAAGDSRVTLSTRGMTPEARSGAAWEDCGFDSATL